MCASLKNHQEQLACETIGDVMRRALQTSMATIENNIANHVGSKYKNSQEHKEVEEAEIAAGQDIWVVDKNELTNVLEVQHGTLGHRNLAKERELHEPVWDVTFPESGEYKYAYARWELFFS